MEGGFLPRACVRFRRRSATARSRGEYRAPRRGSGSKCQKNRARETQGRTTPWPRVLAEGSFQIQEFAEESGWHPGDGAWMCVSPRGTALPRGPGRRMGLAGQQACLCAPQERARKLSFHSPISLSGTPLPGVGMKRVGAPNPGRCPPVVDRAPGGGANVQVPALATCF
jgi:hypothetical protein